MRDFWIFWDEYVADSFMLFLLLVLLVAMILERRWGRELQRAREMESVELAKSWRALHEARVRFEQETGLKVED